MKTFFASAVFIALALGAQASAYTSSSTQEVEGPRRLVDSDCSYAGGNLYSGSATYESTIDVYQVDEGYPEPGESWAPYYFRTYLYSIPSVSSEYGPCVIA